MCCPVCVCVLILNPNINAALRLPLARHDLGPVFQLASWLLSAQQLGQPGNAGSDAPCLVLGHEIGCRSPPGLVLEIDVRHRKAIRVFDDEAGVVRFLDSPWWWKAAARHHRRVHSRATSKITSAPGITSANTKPKNGETLTIIGA